MSKLRRFLLVVACVFALASAGCVEIVNPQFDARYRTGTRPVPQMPYAVFAVYHESGEASATAHGATILVVDTAKNSVVQSITLDGVVALSDVGGPSNAVLAVLEDGFMQVNPRTAETTMLPTAMLSGGKPRGAGFDGKGIRVFWQRAGVSRFLVTRRVGANEQTAAVGFRDVLSRRETVVDLLLMSANEREAYFLSRTVSPSMASTAGLEPDHFWSGRVWRADFATHGVAETGTVTPWPAGFVLADAVHADRAVRRWGLPIATADGTLAFVSLAGKQTSLFATTTVGASGAEIVFEPGGEMYLQVRRQAVPFGAGSMSWAVAEGSVGTTATHIVYQQELPTPKLPIHPLGVIEEDLFAFGIIRPGGLGTGEASASAGALRSTYDLHIRAVDTGRDVVVASIPSPSDSPRADYLGSFTPSK